MRIGEVVDIERLAIHYLKFVLMCLFQILPAT